MKFNPHRRLLIKAVAAATTFAVTISLSIGATRNGSQDEKTLLPTEALHEIFQEMVGQPNKQKEIATKYLAKAKTTDLTSDEQFALGELYFAAVMPDESKAVFEKFIPGNDLKARMAWQSVMLINMRAFQNYDGTENDIRKYRAKFRPVKEDLPHLYWVVFGVADNYRTKGNHEKAIELVMQEIESLPSNAPYYSYGLAATFLDSFKQVGKQEYAIRILEKARDIYTTALAGKDDMPQINNPKAAIAHRPGVLHRVVEGLWADYGMDKYANPTLKKLLSRINTALADAKKSH
ncbi:MAG TPA: hypothetical protein VGX92_10650 [Pyrinomonadaceae bacterium]|nr:hypothetical protein [Pyrinomonadaceae bacterium]